ncbi:hypothetical protein ANCDUO_01398 [Ancylostoma duodenale]|uniref:MULE transposase domain-containing protein n=1 Tax=Ancylostoma duodenale TaxID=51022 RepID=A0A0C2H372_9BILA|nr:hypothetical protein ANCDUO_01398 [Ancylostoma duodenale]
MESKKREAYEKVLGHLKNRLVGFGMDLGSLRLVLDFEKAAIAAARTVFRESELQGCAFHLALSWNRRRNSVGLTRLIFGKDSVPAVSEWWDTIKGLIFLPKRLHGEVRALKEPPVPRGQTWYKGTYANLWDESGITELRTTNVAEAFHRRLGVLIPEDHPNLADLIETLHNLEMDARAALNALDMHPQQQKRIRCKEEKRREEITAAMTEYVQ